ncbi:glycosyltransferase family 15 protein [Hydnomerulius pinastri MD-312]|uniref:Glycosyltransferase family 15 protein n=1 Tax=Hydnomerulius pinastri MD-312 TaxID=994086 RepID=A0A0C9WCT2_9AGAM|nr:glycosyltransferase family 15 protein [Hydnomerulius pinastri MD-312]
MGVPTRHVALVAVLFTLLFIIFRTTFLPSSEALMSLNLPFSTHDSVSLSELASQPNASERANATFVILCRNSNLRGVIQSVRDVEDRFNRKYGYPYVFLNEEPFDEEFKRRVSVLSAAPMEFGTIPKEHWYAPPWIDEQKAAAARKKMGEDGIIYGVFALLCPFVFFLGSSCFGVPVGVGFVLKVDFSHGLWMLRYYWRVEPDVHFHCDVNSDPFRLMQDHNKTYGFTISMYEFEATIESLWATAKDYAQLHPEQLHPHNALGFISDDGGSKYNLCHFWSNFEIADMDFWRSEVYVSFFEFLDQKGGFYYERWGDAPVHSIAAALFLPRSSIHFFDEIGYEHPPYTHCPINGERWTKGRCSCSPAESFDYDGYSCLSRWEKTIRRLFP